MKLANKVYIATLLLLALVFAASAQSNAKSEKDPRNTAPTVGTGGPVGGPTGLFTVYDGSTLRRGEYTFSAAFSNYDRDPGNVDISSVPLSFQVGLTDHVELFFNTEGYRMIKVNSPRNLSSFYLPNSQVAISGFGLTSPPAIVLSPQGPGASLFGSQAIFRPTGAPYVTWPYVGGNAGTYGLLPPFFSGPQFGFAAGTNATLGPPRLGGGSGADLFPGIGSVFGGILPGLVLRTQPLLSPTGAPAGEGPSVFTLAPSYLPDAPFVNAGYRTSAFNSFDVGVKARLTNINSAVGFGFVAAYTFYADNANTASGFNQMQRGAGPGGNLGDISATIFADARLAKWANLSANVGYKWTSKTKGQFPSGKFVMLDRPDELQSSIGVDFPVNKYFQPIAEFRSLVYVAGRTKNAFENNPMDAIFGARIYPVRWAGFGLAYRYMINQQDDSTFDNNQPFRTSIVLGCSPSTQGCTPTTLTQTFTGVPPGFVTSTDPHGFIGQVWIGRRNKRQGDIVNQAPAVDSVALSSTTISLPCPPGYRSDSGACNDSRTISVSTTAHDPENDVLTYNYTVSGGRIVGSGANVQWDLTGAQAGTYTITTAVDDGCGVCGKTNTQTVTVRTCPDCKQICPVCPTLSISGPSGVTKPGDTMTFTLNGVGSDSTVNWSVSAGTIESGQGTSSITVRAPADGSVSNITATAEVGGISTRECSCPNTASETAPVGSLPQSRSVWECPNGSVKCVPDVIKAGLDILFGELNADPQSKGYIVYYGDAKDQKKFEAAIKAGIKFRKYDMNRIVLVNGGDNGGGPSVKMWVVPEGARPPGS